MSTTEPRLKGTDEHTPRIVAALCRRGVSKSMAVTLAASYRADEIQRAMEALDEQVRLGSQIRHADAWFAVALKRGYQPSAARQQSLKRPELRVFRGRPSGD